MTPFSPVPNSRRELLAWLSADHVAAPARSQFLAMFDFHRTFGASCSVAYRMTQMTLDSQSDQVDWFALSESGDIIPAYYLVSDPDGEIVQSIVFGFYELGNSGIARAECQCVIDFFGKRSSIRLDDDSFDIFSRVPFVFSSIASRFLGEAGQLAILLKRFGFRETRPPQDGWIKTSGRVGLQ